MKNSNNRKENGYIALTTVLILIPILLMTGIALIYSNISLLVSTQSLYASALSNTQYSTCLEESILKVKRNHTFTGTSNLTFTNFSCTSVISDYQGNTNTKKIDITITSGIYTNVRTQIVDISVSPFIVKNP